MAVSKGNVADQQKVMHGWLVGQFMPKGQFKDDNVEIYCKTFPVGKVDDRLHMHPKGREYLIVLSGKVRMRIGDEVVEFSVGDYVAIPGGTPDCLLETLEPLTILGVRYPSVPDNKVFLD